MRINRFRDRNEHDVGFLSVSRAASAGVATLVDSVWTVEASRCSAAVEAALPDTAAEVYFNLGSRGRSAYDGSGPPPPLTRSRGWVLGPRTKTMLVAKEIEHSHIVGVRLRPGAVGAVFGVSAGELTDRLTDLECLIGSAALDRLIEQLSLAKGVAARFEVVEAAVSEWSGWAGEAGGFGTVLATAARTARSIGELAEHLGLSHRRVIHQFDHWLGFKPKRFVRVERLRSVIRTVHSEGEANWAALAAAHGFVDQPHLIHDFRRLTGMRPSDYLTHMMAVGEGFVRYQRPDGTRPFGRLG